MKIALGLFHFNVQYVAGDVASYHRYCTQAVIPFLRIIAGNPNYRVTIAMAGSGLEFLASQYPESIDLMRNLIAEKRVELISSTYTPTFWVAFPQRDLIKSIEINQHCLGELGLTASDIFFAQEAFFGPGIKKIGHLFSIAVCKEDYLRYFFETDSFQPIYQLGAVRVVVGRNHLLNELRRITRRHGTNGAEFSAFFRKKLDETERLFSESNEETAAGSTREVEWYWYHVGSGHHFCTWSSPEQWETFFADPAWMRLNIRVLDRLIAEGYQLGSITELARALDDGQCETMPPIVEGSLNSGRSQGVYAWMGRQQGAWENDAGILGLAWRSRANVRKCEAIAERTANSYAKKETAVALLNLWKQQLFAESSDPLGWAPLPTETIFGRVASENSLQASSRFLAEAAASGMNCETDISNPAPTFLMGLGRRTAQPWVCAEFVGAEGEVQWMDVGDQAQICEVLFRASDTERGIRFERASTYVTYCPSGMEDEPITIDLSQMRPEEVYLPLANGLIGVREGIWLVRLNEFGQMAVRISKRDSWLTFAIEGEQNPMRQMWRFVVLKGTVEFAVEMANVLNRI